MLLAALFYSFVPLAVELGDGSSAPWLFASLVRLGVSLGCLVLLILRYRCLLFNTAVWRRVGPLLFTWSMFWGVVGYGDLALYPWAARYVDLAVATVLFQLWPVTLVVVMLLLFRNGAYRGTYRWNPGSLLALFVLVFLGTVLLVSAQAGGVPVLGTDLRLGWSVGFGLFLGFLSAWVVALAAFAIRWGADLGLVLARDGFAVGLPARELFFFGGVLGYGLGCLVAAPVFIGAGLLSGERYDWELAFYGVGGGVVMSVAGISLRWSNLLTRNLGVNLLSCLVPALAVAWLFLAFGVGVPRPDYLLAGLLVVLAANVLAGMNGRRQAGKSLIAVLAGGGALLMALPAGGEVGS